jgi:uncharacterized Fe-S radical SAM superfamily protein PflX
MRYTYLARCRFKCIYRVNIEQSLDEAAQKLKCGALMHILQHTNNDARGIACGVHQRMCPVTSVEA